jgi:hypothetical protein
MLKFWELGKFNVVFELFSKPFGFLFFHSDEGLGVVLHEVDVK